jgi:LysM repeat protein
MHHLLMPSVNLRLQYAGSIRGTVRNGLGVWDAIKTLDNTPTIENSIALIDQIFDVGGVALGSFNLEDDMDKGKLRQTLSYSFSYIVQKGDNLTQIAKQLNTTPEELSKQNGIKDMDKLDVGQKLKFSGKVFGGFESGNGGGSGVSGNY